VPVLSLRKISKNFGAIRALSDVDLDLDPGEVLGLMGDNGAGKSTLVKIIAGNFPPTSGDILLQDRPVHFHKPVEARESGIEIVYQDLALCDNLTATANVFLSREIGRRFGPFKVLDSRAMNERAGELFGELKSETRPRDLVRRMSGGQLQAVATLSGGQRQSVAVARAVMWNSRLVILDEPTAALGVAQTEQVLALVKRLAEQGLGVVLISHNLHDIFEVADRITVLRLGRNAGLFERASTTQQEVVHAITAGQPTKVAGITQDVVA